MAKICTINGYKIKTSTGKNIITEYYTPTVHIGEHDYPYVKIGNLYWISQDLYEPLGNFGNRTGTDSCWVDWEDNNPKGMMYKIGRFFFKYKNT